MAFVLPVVLTSLSAYLLGSINSAILICRLLRLPDIRQKGSGNAGMTNMLRVYGKKAALLTTGGDVLKAVLAVLMARFVIQIADVQLLVDPGYLAGVFVMLGHIFPVFFAFKGGKGVMPALGIILLVNPLGFLVLLLLAVPIFLLSRTVSLVSLICTLLLPPVTWLMALARHHEPYWAVGITLIYVLLVIWSHRANIKRLLRGEEKKISPGSKDE